jgi:HlyD family secretion protein
MNIRYHHLGMLYFVMILVACGKKTVETKPVRKDVIETVFASGVLEADGTYNLNAQAEGILVAVKFEEGEIVNEKQLLAIIDNKENQTNTQSASALYEIAVSNTQNVAPALVEAQLSINTAREKLTLDSIQYSRHSRLLQTNSIPKNDYDNSQLAFHNSRLNLLSAIEKYKQVKQQADQQLISASSEKKIRQFSLNNNEVRTPVKGRILKKLKQPGDFVKKGDAIAQIGDPHFIYAKVNIDETNIARIRVNDIAVIQLNVHKDKSYKALVAEILPAFDENTQSFVCKLYFSDSLDFTISGTQLQANIIVDTQYNALLIPSNFLDFSGRVQIKGRKEKTDVVTKFIGSEWVQVLSGIDEQTTLTTDNIPENRVNTSEAGAQIER